MTASEQLNLHGERAAVRGNPSFVWRAGQQRRLEMILDLGAATEPSFDRVLVDGCGVGMYVRALAPYSRAIFGIDIEPEHLALARTAVEAADYQLAACEALPYPDGYFDLVLSHEVLEHVRDDRLAACEMVRVLRPGGRAVIFAPNRFYPFETHGHYWQGEYRFGNTPLINYLPDPLRNRLAPHVRAYTPTSIRRLFVGLPVRIVQHSQVFAGYDNIVARWPTVGRLLRDITYAMEKTPLELLGLSHLLVVERSDERLNSALF